MQYNILEALRKCMQSIACITIKPRIAQKHCASCQSTPTSTRHHFSQEQQFSILVKENRPCTWISLLNLLGLLSTAIETLLILSPRSSFPLFKDVETFENIITLSLVYRFPDEVHALHTVFFSHNK